MTFERTHISFPLTTAEGDLLTYADVTFIDISTGQPSTAAFYLTNDEYAEPLSNPATFTPGIIDLWCDEPVRLNLIISGPDGYTATMYGLDLMPSPESIAKASPNAYNEISTQSQTGRMLLSNGTTQYWGHLDQIETHDHDGVMAGSTVLMGDAPTADTTTNQTWLGYGADGDGHAAIYSSALGAYTNPSAERTTLLGAHADIGDGEQAEGEEGFDSVFLGLGAYGGPNTVSFGAHFGGASSVSLPSLSGELTGPPCFTETGKVSVKHAYLMTALSGVGGFYDADGLYVSWPETPGGVANPLWLRTDVVVPGALTVSGNALLTGDTVLAGDSRSLGFYEHGGAGKDITVSNATGALASLLSKLDMYGLLKVHRIITWSGYDWAVRAKVLVNEPGPNAWSDDPDYASVDTVTDQLTVAIKQDGAIWNCVELEGPHLGYGKYSFVLATDPYGMDIKPVLGLFTYDDTDLTGEFSYREIDIEVSKWNYAPEPSRMWYSVQATNEPKNSDHAMDTAIPYTCEFTWQPGQVYFRTLDNDGVLLGEHLVTEGVFAPGGETVRVNLWLSGGTGAPVDGLPCEMKLDSFTFTPDVTYTLPVASTQVNTFAGPGMGGIALKDGVSMVGGVLTIPCTTPIYSVAFTGSIYNLEDSSVDISIIGAPEAGGWTAEALWFVRYNADNMLSMFISGANLYTRLRQAAVDTDFHVGEYDPVAHQYLRIRESAGTIYFDTSPDRADWTNVHSVAHSLGVKLASMRCWFECGYYGVETSPLPLRVDSINTA